MSTILEFFSYSLYIFLILALVYFFIILYFKIKFSYWSKRNLSHLVPTVPFGTMEKSLSRTVFLSAWIEKNYHELRSMGYKHGGLYNFASPIYLPVDPQYIKNVMVTDFQHFQERGVYYNERDDPLSANIISLGGDRWKNIRSKLTASFTPGKLKQMLATFLKSADTMHLEIARCSFNRTPLDIKETTARYTIEVLASCTAGLDINSSGNDNIFRNYGRRMVRRANFRAIFSLVFLSIPQVGRFFKTREYSKDTSDFFLSVIRQAVEYRKTNKVSYRDILQTLVEELLKSSDSMSVEEVAAHMFALFIAGFETSSATTCYGMFELATHPEIQERLGQEIASVLKKHEGQITYETLNEMSYLNQVVEETMRKYPVVGHITRKCSQDYRVPGTDVVIEKGTGVFISPLGVHHNPDFYPEPEKFDPERFNEENKRNRPSFTYIPFGEGPRMCIGMRFGLLQVKIGFVTMLNGFRYRVNNETKLPLEYDPLSLTMAPKQVVWLDVEKI